MTSSPKTNHQHAGLTTTDKMIKTIIFDLDGTLIDSEADLAAATNFALKSVGEQELPQERVTSFIGNGLRVLLQKALGPGKDALYPEVSKAFAEFYLDHLTDHTTLYPRVKEFLVKFSPSIKMGIVTNKHQVFAEKIVKAFQIDPYIKAILGCDTVLKPKPHPDPLLDTLKVLKGDPGTAMMVGDGPQDLIAGKAAGMKTCVTTYGFGYHPSLMDLKPDFIIHEFKDLEKIIS